MDAPLCLRDSTVECQEIFDDTYCCIVFFVTENRHVKEAIDRHVEEAMDQILNCAHVW